MPLAAMALWNLDYVVHSDLTPELMGQEPP